MDSSSREVFRMSDGFYRAFEERYRGSRELIRERFATYLPFVEPLLRFIRQQRPLILVVVGVSGLKC